MPHMPVLRVVPLESIRRHEEIDPLRVERLKQRIASDGMQANPMVCIQAPEGELVLLDGATRAESLKTLGLAHAVVQIVDAQTVDLGTWHHVVRGGEPSEIIATVEDSPALVLNEDYGTPSVHPNKGASRLVSPADGVSSNQAMSALVASYTGRWEVTRATDPHREQVAASYPGWSAVIEFPTLTVHDVIAAAVSEDLLPAGVTRFVVPDRALRLNVSLDLLEVGASTSEAQGRLDEVLDRRSSDGRVRRYEGPVVVLDD
jgi:hypothetical protein